MNRIEDTTIEKLYYDKNDVKVRDARFSDLPYLERNLRESDVNEIWASHHLKPYDALCQSFAHSTLSLTGTIKEEPFIIFGCNPIADGKLATIWMLATDKISEVRIEFVKYSRHFVEIMLEDYPVLYNYVDARNAKSIAWLRMINAEISEPIPYGLDRLPFHYFEFRR